MDQDTVGQTHRSAAPTPAYRQASSRASCSPPGLDCKVEIWWRITSQRRHGEKDGEARHRVMFDAGHLTLECGSAMVLSLLVMDEPPMSMARPTVRRASTATPMSMLRTSFRHRDRFSTVHQLTIPNCGTANTLCNLFLCVRVRIFSISGGMSFACVGAAAAVCSLTAPIESMLSAM